MLTMPALTVSCPGQQEMGESLMGGLKAMAAALATREGKNEVEPAAQGGAEDELTALQVILRVMGSGCWLAVPADFQPRRSHLTNPVLPLHVTFLLPAAGGA